MCVCVRVLVQPKFFVVGQGVPNDMFAYATVVTVGTAVTGTTTGATHEANEQTLVGSGTHSTWYTLAPSATGTYTIQTLQSSFDTTLGVYKSSNRSISTASKVRVSHCCSLALVFECVASPAAASRLCLCLVPSMPVFLLP